MKNISAIYSYEILSESTLELTYSSREKIIIRNISMYLVNLYV